MGEAGGVNTPPPGTIAITFAWLLYTNLAMWVCGKYLEMPPLLALIAGAAISCLSLFAVFYGAYWLLGKFRNRNTEISN